MATTKAELYSKLRAPEPGMKQFTKVAGSDRINLAPTLTGSGISASGKRGGMEYAVASLSGVQSVLDGMIFVAYIKAQKELQLIRAAAFSFGDIRNHWVSIDQFRYKPGVDRYLMLSDTKSGFKGAMSIEFGRSPYTRKTDEGDFKIDGMTGKFILHKAFGVPPNSLHGTGGGDL